MQASISIKGIQIGGGKPVICVPIVSAQADDIIADAKHLIDSGVHMAEWRVDCFSQFDDAAAVKAVLDRLAPLFTDTVFLFTIRTKDQGGNVSPKEDYLVYLQEMAAKTGWVDFIDIELFERTRPEKAIRRIHQFGCRVITSHHDFSKTPEEVVLHMLFDHMYRVDTDIAKVAMMPNNSDDVARLLKFSSDTKSIYPKMPMIVIGMGQLGMITRITGEVFGSCVTFGALGAGSAPGQIQVDKLEELLDLFHPKQEA